MNKKWVQVEDLIMDNSTCPLGWRDGRERKRR